MALPKHGDPAWLGVMDFNTNGDIEDFCVDGHPGMFDDFDDVRSNMEEDIIAYGGRGTVYLCIPVVDVEERKPRASVTKLELMARAAVVIDKIFDER